MPRRSTQGPDEVMEALKRTIGRHVRTAKIVIERAVIMTTGTRPGAANERACDTECRFGSPRTLEDAERAHITKTLHETIGLTAGGVALLPSSDWPGQPSLQ